MSRELLSKKLKYYILFVVYSYLKNYRQFGRYSCDGGFLCRYQLGLWVVRCPTILKEELHHPSTHLDEIEMRLHQYGCVQK